MVLSKVIFVSKSIKIQIVEIRLTVWWMNSGYLAHVQSAIIHLQIVGSERFFRGFHDLKHQWGYSWNQFCQIRLEFMPPKINFEPKHKANLFKNPTAWTDRVVDRWTSASCGKPSDANGSEQHDVVFNGRSVYSKKSKKYQRLMMLT